MECKSRLQNSPEEFYAEVVGLKIADEFPGGFRPHAAFGEGKDPVEMQTADHRHRNGRTACHRQSEKGSRAPPCPVAHPADSQGDEELRENPEETNAILHVTC